MWTAIRDELVRGGARTDGSVVLLLCENRAVVSSLALIGGQPTVLLLAPIARATECNAERALHLAPTLGLGSFVVVQQMLALRHLVALSATTADSLVAAATQLARAAAVLAPALRERSQPRPEPGPEAGAHAFACFAE